MKKAWKKLSSIILTLLMIGCNPSSPNLSTFNDSNKVTPVSIHNTNKKMPDAITSEEIRELDKEYSFKTKALTKAYLTGKLLKWIALANSNDPVQMNDGAKLLREVVYAKYKHPDTFCEVMNDPANSDMLEDIKVVPAVSTRMDLDHDFRDFINGCSTTPSSNIIYVDDDAAPGGDGTSWGTAYKSLHDALETAQSGNDIWIAAGTYKPDYKTVDNALISTGDITDTFHLKNGVRVYGGFEGVEPVIGDRETDPDINIGNKYVREVILSGDIGTEGVNTDNSNHVTTGANNSTLDGVTIKDGNAGPGSSGGGGMFNLGSSPTLINVTFSNNSASDIGGAGMANYQSLATLTNVLFSNNSITNLSCMGGGMYNNFSLPTLTNVIFSNNSAPSGGGMYNDNSSSLILNKVTFSNNSAFDDGGGSGGGIFNINSSATLTNVIFSNNSAFGTGGGMYNFNSPTTITNVTFFNNSASGLGVGLSNNMSSTATIKNTIFWGNTSQGSGNNIYNSATLKIGYSDLQGGFASILNDTVDGVSFALDGITPITDGDSFSSALNINTDPYFFDPFNPAGSDGIFMTSDDGLTLKPDSGGKDNFPSHVIDAGTTDGAPATDILGNPRDGSPDMGAYEYLSP